MASVIKILTTVSSFIAIIATCFVLWRGKAHEEKFLQFSPSYGKMLIIAQCMAFALPSCGFLLCLALYNSIISISVVLITSINLFIFIVHGTLSGYLLNNIDQAFIAMDLQKVISDPASFSAMNALQSNMSCCGINSSSNWFLINHWWTNDTKVNNRAYVTPPSCCHVEKNCTYFSNVVGCEKSLKDYMMFALTMYIFFSGSLVLIEIALLLSFFLSSKQNLNTSQQKSEKATSEKEPLLAEKSPFSLSLPSVPVQKKLNSNSSSSLGSEKSKSSKTKDGENLSAGDGVSVSLQGAGSIKKTTSKQEKKKRSKYLQHGSLSEEGDPDRDKRLSEFTRLQEQADKAIGSFN